MTSRTLRRGATTLGAVLWLTAPSALAQAPQRPFGTLREQAAIQQQWLARRLDTILPAVMRKYGVDMWVIPMREYNEDPTFSSLVSPTTFAARRRTIYVFYDRGPEQGVERLALGGSSQGGLYEAVRSARAVSTGIGGQAGRTAELWGDQQWLVLKDVIEARNPKKIALNVSRTFNFADGLSAGELEGMTEMLGPAIAAKFTRVDGLAVDFIALRVPEEDAYFRKLQDLVWSLIDEMFSSRTITPGVTRTSDLVWWWRQRVNDLGIQTWFQPSIGVQRQGATDADLGEDPVIQRGDVLWCDVGITALRLNTDTQHNAYVLREGETDAPAGLRKALGNGNRFQDILFEEVRPGRTGNQILAGTLAKMKADGLDGTMYSHPVGMHGHGAGTIIGLWDYQEGVPGRGDFPVSAGMWYSAELQVTTAVPEWGGQKVRIAQEEDFFVGQDGMPRWVKGRQDRFHLVR